MKKYLVASAILLSFIGCSKKMDVADTTVPYVHVPVQFTVKEDFEMGTKAAYAIGDVSGPPLLAHAASHEGVVAAEHLSGLHPHAIDKMNSGDK